MEDRVIINRAEYDLLVAQAYQKVYTTYTSHYEDKVYVSTSANEVFEGLKAELEALEEKYEAEAKEKAEYHEKKLNLMRKEIKELKDGLYEVADRKWKDKQAELMDMSIFQFSKWRKANG